MKTPATHHPLRAHPVAGLRRETPRRDLSAGERHAALLILIGTLTALAMIVITTLSLS